MLARGQAGVLIGYAVLLWLAATAFIRFAPRAIADPVGGDLGYVSSLPVCWLCIVLLRRLGRLAHGQLVPAAALVVGVATLIDAVALRWMPALYGFDDHVLRLGAAWLLWGYGVMLVMVLLMDRRRARWTGIPVEAGTTDTAWRARRLRLGS